MKKAGKTGKSEGKAITMAMISQNTGVSQGAISALLNDRDYGIRVSPKTRERILRVCREMGYIPNDLRAVVRMYPEQGELALLSSTTFPFETANALSRALAAKRGAKGVHIAHYQAETDYTAHPERLPEAVRGSVVSQYILYGEPNESLLEAITRHGSPVIFIGQEMARPGVTSIVPDWAALARLGVEHLFRLGRRALAILSGPFGSTDPMIVALNQGVHAAYDALKTPLEAQNIIYGDTTFEHGEAAMSLLLERPTRPDAIFCFADSVAAGVLSRAQEQGLRIPGDLSVLGFGDDPFSRRLYPALSTIALPVEEMADLALEELSRRLREKENPEARTIPLQGRLVERASCVK